MRKAWVVGLALLLFGCNRAAPEATRQRAAEPLMLGPEDIARAQTGEVITGPILSGELTSAEQATVRAQIGGSLTEVNARVGERVKQGQVLARVRAIAEREAVGSAQASVRTAEVELDAAVRDRNRIEVLVKAGALAQRDLEQAETGVAAARARVAEAQARLAASREQLNESIVRAPISGVISAASVDTGDVVALGAELFTIVNPAVLELRASVPAENLGAIRVGTPVLFTVQGYPDRQFRGTLRRMAPAADPATGQVEVFASLPNDTGQLVTGLYAQGRVGTGSTNAIVLPEGAVQSRGNANQVLKVEGGKVVEQRVTLGARDERSGRIEVKQGLQEGDAVLVGAATRVTPGTPVQLR